MRAVKPCRVRVAVPHFYREGTAEVGYGSTRAGTRVARQVALSRCLAGVLALNRQVQDLILNPAEQALELSPPIRDNTTRLAGVLIDLHVFVNGEHYLQEILEHFADRLTLHQLQLEDPRQLPQAAADWLCHQPEPAADLHLYFEDDLVIQDPRYVDKQVWFTERTQHRFCVDAPSVGAVCGAGADAAVCGWPCEAPGAAGTRVERPGQELARGTFWDGRSVGFAVASNPHSGSFCLSEPQRQQLLARGAVPTPFVGPLETAATGTVLDHFPVLKPLWPERDFLCVEHGHPSFLLHLGQMPLRKPNAPVAEAS